MGFWGKLFKVTEKVGETALDVATTVYHVDALEHQIQGIGRRQSVTPDDIAILLQRVDSIRAGVNSVRK